MNAQEWKAGTQRKVTRLSDLGARVYLIRDTPAPRFAVPACLSRALWTDLRSRRSCGFELNESLRPNLQPVEAEAAAISGVRYLDLTDLICPGGHCAPEAKGEVIYDNGNYVTPSFVRKLTNVFQDALDGNR